MKTWTHPKLGKFKFDEVEWVGSCALPAFKSFCHGGSSRSKIPLSFEADYEDEFPSKLAAKMAERIVANNETLAEKITGALWRDLCGKGRESGMWWHGDIESVLANINSGLPAKKQLTGLTKGDVVKIIGRPRIWVREKVDHYEKPCAVVCFSAAFDSEHGLGVLTNGTSILGLGYQMSVGPY